MFLTGVKIVIICLLTLTIADLAVLRPIFGLGYPTHYEEEDLQRYPAPYIAFKGKPNALDHDQWGYRHVPAMVPDDALRIAFFGGSTGYRGNPPIAPLLQDKLSKRLQRRTAVANFSVVSSNHRQHLHNLLESRSIFEPDIVIFYGGYNETLGSGFNDPRPGYPYNFFYREETSPLVKLLLRHSAFFGLLDQALLPWGLSLTPLARLRNEYKPFSFEWNQAIVDNYIETLTLANAVQTALPSRRCGAGKFIAFYQPFQVIDSFKEAHQRLRDEFARLSFAVDVSDAYDSLGPSIFVDRAHVQQIAHDTMSYRMADAIIERGIANSCR
jgi:hypothetical protein